MSKLATLLRRKPLVLDGAWGTELQQLGLAAGACPDAWNLDHPERVSDVARRYVVAGSQIVLTNTFGANRVALCRHGLADRTSAINRAGAEISLRAAADAAAVVASVGPTGKLLALGDIGEIELRQAFEEQLVALAEGGVDAVVFETFTDIDELCIGVTTAKQLGLFTVGSMVFDSGAKKDRTAMGVSLEVAVSRLTAIGADAIGANCGRGVEAYVSICQRLAAMTTLPLWLKPNAGLPQLMDGRACYATDPRQFASGVLELVAAGASLVGGCCGTSPKFVGAICEALGRRA